MNIQDLWNELLGLEYCIKTILKELLKEAKKSTHNKELINELKDFNLDDIEIITEWFVNNCFLKKLKFWWKDKPWFIKFLDEIEKRPTLMKILLWILVSSFALYWTIKVAQINADTEILKLALAKWEVSNEVMENIKNSSLTDESKIIALELIWNNKFREAAAKTIIPIRNKDDYLELSSPALKENIVINNLNKSNLLLNTKSDTNDNIDNEISKYDKIIWRISSINLDAIKNQIWFKVLNEWTEIKCHLKDNLNISDYKEWYLWEWVELEWNIYYTDEKTNFIEIVNIQKTNAPLAEAEQIVMSN